MSGPRSGDDAVDTRGLVIGLVLGTPLLAFGIVGLVTSVPVANTISTATWAALLLALHDAVLVPVVLAVVWVVHRFTPAVVRAPLVAGVLGSALVAALAAPGVLDLGNPSGNPTVHPFDTGFASVVALGLVWLVVAAWAAVSVWRPRRPAS